MTDPADELEPWIKLWLAGLIGCTIAAIDWVYITISSGIDLGYLVVLTIFVLVVSIYRMSRIGSVLLVAVMALWSLSVFNSELDALNRFFVLVYLGSSICGAIGVFMFNDQMIEE